MKRELHPNPAGRNRLSPRPDHPFVSECLESRVLLAATAVSASLGAGAYPDGGIAVDASGNVFGTTTFGGTNGFGTIFEIAHGSPNVTTLASFSGGQQPFGNLILDSNGDLFGMTASTAYSFGSTVFELARGSSTITTLASSGNFSVTVGSIVRDGQGNIFGIAGGTIFEVAAGSSSVTILASFNNDSSSGNLVIDANDDLFGTTIGGTIFELASGSSTPTMLYKVVDEAINGLIPDNSGHFYGTYGNGPGGWIYRINQDGTGFTTLSPLPAGINAILVSIDGGGNLYGISYRDAGTLFGLGSSGFDGLFELANGSSATTTLATFGSNKDEPTPAFLAADASGDLYGTLNTGGANQTGAVFEWQRGSPTITMLASFAATSADFLSPLATFGANSTGVNPNNVVVDAAGNLYGTTQNGGAFGLGAIFEIAHGSSAITTLASFDGSGGWSPEGNLLIDAKGNLFGATQSGGLYGGGTIFELARGSSTVSTVASIQFANPPGVILTMDGHGNIFGVTSEWVFEIPAGSSTSTVLVTGPFNSPTGNLVVDGNDNLYFAIDQLGPADQDGIIYELPSGSTTLTTLFAFNSTTGTLSSGVISDDAGHLYASAGSVIFRINEDGSGYSTFPAAGLLSVSAVDGAGNLYGETGPSNPAIVELPHGSSSIMVLGSFPLGAPSSTLAIDTAGNIYGTYAGNQNNFSGAVFELPAGGSTVNTIATLQPYVTQTPTVGLIAGKDGTLYGVANGGGAYDFGSVYEIAPGSSAITPIASFTSEVQPEGQIAMDSKGDIFGATLGGGTSGIGSIYEVPAGSSTIITLASFDGLNGFYPLSGIVMDRNGNLFGTTVQGGAFQEGTIFELTPGSNTIATLVSFDRSDGEYPNGQIAIDADGNFYGTTADWIDYGTVFELASGSSQVTTLFSFSLSIHNDDPGISPGALYARSSGLVVDSTGNVFVTAADGGEWGAGAVLQIAPNGAVSTLFSFPSVRTGSPAGELMLDSAGDLYGITQPYPNIDSTIFELAPAQTFTDVSLHVGGSQRGGALDFNGIAEDSLGNVYVTSVAGISKLSPIPFAETITGTQGADDIALSQDPDHHNIDWSVNGAAPSVLPINDINGLTINGNGGDDTITLDYSNGNPLPATLHLNGNFTINGLQGADPLAGRTLDVGTSTVFLNYGTPSNDPIFAIRQYLQSGYNHGAWNGTPASAIDGTIMSSAAQNNTAGTTGVGFADWADGQGVDTVPNTIELKYTVDGDANLDGQVNSADLQILLFGLNRPGSWDQGDFNYDGQVNSADLQALLFTLNTGLGNQATPLAVGAAPAAATGSGASASNTSSRSIMPLLHPVTSTTAHVSHPAKPAARKRR